MNKQAPFKIASALALLLFATATHATAAQAKREHLSPEEVELIRDNQQLDKRTEVFVRAAERRMLAVTNPDEAARQAAKDKEKWGEVQGTRTQLVYDISKILDEAVVNIDDAALHNPESPLLRKSLFKLSEAAARLLPQLSKLREGSQEEAEAAQLDRAIEAAQEILDAAKERGVTAEDLKSSKGGKKGN